MEATIVQQLIVVIPNLWVAVFMLWYFMKRDDRKELQNQANLQKFIDIQKDTIQVFWEANKIQAQSIEVLNSLGDQVKSMENFMRDGKVCKSSR